MACALARLKPLRKCKRDHCAECRHGREPVPSPHLLLLLPTLLSSLSASWLNEDDFEHECTVSFDALRFLQRFESKQSAMENHQLRGIHGAIQKAAHRAALVS